MINEIVGNTEMSENIYFGLEKAKEKYPKKRVFHVIENENGDLLEDFDNTNEYFTNNLKEAVCFIKFEDARDIAFNINGRVRKIVYRRKEKWHLSVWGSNFPLPNERKIKYLIECMTDGFGKKHYNIVSSVKYNKDFFVIEAGSKKEAEEKINKFNS